MKRACKRHSKQCFSGTTGSWPRCPIWHDYKVRVAATDGQMIMKFSHSKLLYFTRYAWMLIPCLRQTDRATIVQMGARSGSKPPSKSPGPQATKSTPCGLVTRRPIC